MTFDQLYLAVCLIGIPLYLVMGTRKDDWNWIVILTIFCLGICVVLWIAFVAWVFDELKYFPSWLLFQETGQGSSRWIAVGYGFIVASILLALRHLATSLRGSSDD